MSSVPAHFKFGALSIDTLEFASRSNAILGIKDSGKTYTATVLAEKLFDAGIPFIAFDPIGVWRFLRVPGAGKGYPVVVAGGQDGDLPLTVASAPEIVRSAMLNGVSLVIDLFSMDLSKADWRAIVMVSTKVLLHENQKHGLRHVFLEEAAEFIPQKVIDGLVYAEVEKLARMGGNSRLGLTIINQRAEEVNKAVLELCDNLFLHRQKGRNSLTALSKWLDVANVTDGKEIIDTMSTLPTGECWAWLHGSDRPFRVKVPRKNSLHPDRRVMRGDALDAPRPPVDVADFVEAMRTALKDVEEKAKADDPKALRAEIARLKREAVRAVAADPQEIEAAERRGYERAVGAVADRLRGIRIEMVVGRNESAPLMTMDGEMAGAFFAAEAKRVLPRDFSDWDVCKAAIISASSFDEAKSDMPLRAASLSPPTNRRQNGSATPAKRPQNITENITGRSLGPERRPLAVLAGAHPGGLTEAQWAVGTGMKRTGGTWAAYKSRLRSAGMITQDGSIWYATEDGVEAAGSSPEPMPAPGPEHVEFWARRIDGASRMLRVIAGHPRGLTREQLADALNMTASGGTFTAYLSRLRSPGLIETSGGVIRATDFLMGRR